MKVYGQHTLTCVMQVVRIALHAAENTTDPKIESEVVQEPLPLKPGILVKKSVVLVKRKTDLLKPSPGQKTLEK